MGLEEARRHLNRAKKQLDRAQILAWDTQPDEGEEAVTWTFYAIENAIVALAEGVGRSWVKNHARKAALAAEFFREGLLSIDVHDWLLELNELRKDVQYGEPGADLLEVDTGEMVARLEALIGEVEGHIRALAQGKA